MAKQQLAVDETVKIPAAVKAQAARAEEIHKASYAKEPPPEPSKDSPPKAATNIESSPPVEPAEAPEAPVEIPPIAPTPVSPPTEKPMSVEPPRDAHKAPEGQNWEHAYKSMKGRFDRAQEQLGVRDQAIRSLQDQIDSLQTTIAGMRQAPPAPKEAEPERFVTDKDREDYGDDLLQVVGRRAKEEFIPIIKGLEAQVADLKAQLQGTHNTVARTAEERFFQTLDDKLPKWRELNNNDDFIAWLALPDRYSGVIRHKLLTAAREQHDAPRALAFFQGFLSEAASVPGVELDHPPAPASSAPASGVKLEDLAAPGRAKSTAASTPAPVEKPFISRAQISRFYADVAAGRYRGRDDEKKRLDDMIFEAANDGRITQ